MDWPVQNYLVVLLGSRLGDTWPRADVVIAVIAKKNYIGSYT